MVLILNRYLTNRGGDIVCKRKSVRGAVYSLLLQYTYEISLRSHHENYVQDVQITYEEEMLIK